MKSLLKWTNSMKNDRAEHHKENRKLKAQVETYQKLGGVKGLNLRYLNELA